MLTTLEIKHRLIDTQSDIDSGNIGQARDMLADLLAELGDAHTTYVLVTELYTGEDLEAEEPDGMTESEFASLENAQKSMRALFDIDRDHARFDADQNSESKASCRITEYQSDVMLNAPDGFGYRYIRYIVQRDMQYKLLPQCHDMLILGDEADPIHDD